MMPTINITGADYVQVVEDRPIQFATENSPNNLVFSYVSLMAIFVEFTENERIIDRHLRGIHPCSITTLLKVSL